MSGTDCELHEARATFLDFVSYGADILEAEWKRKNMNLLTPRPWVAKE